MRIRIQGVNICGSGSRSSFYQKLVLINVRKQKKNFGSGSKCRSGSRSRDSRKCGSGSMDSIKADPMLIRNPEYLYPREPN